MSGFLVVSLNAPGYVLVEGQTVELRSFHWLASAPGKEDDRQDDDKDDCGQDSGGDDFENELNRFLGKLGEDL